MNGEHVGMALGEHVTDIVAVFAPGADGPLVYLNRIGRRLLRIDDAAMASTRITDLAASGERERLASILEIVEADDLWAGPIEMASPISGEFPTRSTLCRVDLSNGVEGLAWVAKDTTTDRDVIRTLRERAFFDQLTGLPHRSLFLDRLDLLLRRVDSDATGVCVLVLSPDRFKEKANRYDHGTSDLLIKTIAQRVPQTLHLGQSLHRWSDEDFIILGEGINDEASARSFALAVAQSFVQPFSAGTVDIFLTASIGVAIGQPGALTTDTLLRQAEDAARIAQRRGGDTIQVFDESLRAIAERKADIEDGLRTAITNQELSLLFQPEVSLRTGHITGCEALLRWDSPRLGSVSPAEFVPVAEAANLIGGIGDWVLRTALTQSSAWSRDFVDRPPLLVAVNISAHQFGASDFTRAIADLIAATGADPTAICLEITESALLDDTGETVDKLLDLKRLGVQLAIDDFGTGYSSLSYLRRFPIDILKVDQTFMSGLGKDPEDSAIVQAVIHMGQALGMVTIAEGVESDHQVIELRELQCDIAQGYLYARPMPASDLTALLVKGDNWR